MPALGILLPVVLEGMLLLLLWPPLDPCSTGLVEIDDLMLALCL